MLTKAERDKLDIDSRLYLCYDYILAIEKDRILATHGIRVSLITDKAEMKCTYDDIIVPTKPGDVSYNEETLEFYADEEFVSEYLIYKQDGKHGIINYDGEIIIEAQYSSIVFGEDGEVYVLP